MTDIDYDSLEQALAGLGIYQPGSEYHGTLAGMIAAGINPPVDLGLTATTGSGEAAESARALLERLRGDTAEDFVDEAMGFKPLLPDDSVPLPDRVESLAAWCQGFLVGAASRPDFSMEQLSDDAREVVNDFSDIAKAGSSEETDAEEAAYVELIEYVRVGAQMLFFELHADDDKTAQAAIH